MPGEIDGPAKECYIANMTNTTELHDIPATLRVLRANLDLTQEQLA